MNNYSMMLLNDIIEEAIRTGGDAGGPYATYSNSLNKAISTFLYHENLNENYCIYNDEFGTKIILKDGIKNF